MVCVGIDGIDGAGKTTFADELAGVLTDRSIHVVRSTIDSFHAPRAVRWARGRCSPEGFYRDSHDLSSLHACLLDPLIDDPPGPFRTAAFDEPSDSAVDAPVQDAVPGMVLLFDGIFLHRPELRARWDLSIYLDGGDRVARGRSDRASRNVPPGPAGLIHLVRWWCFLDRYIEGQRLYLDECQPTARADVVVLNDELAAPRVVSVYPYVLERGREMRTRRAVRVLLLDPRDRLLLFRVEDDTFTTPGHEQPASFWLTVGGGAEAGESMADTARREVFEETGHCDLVLGPQLWEQETIVRFREEDVRGADRYVVGWVGDDAVSFDQLDGLERAVFREHRWWTLADVEDDHSEAMVPAEIGRLLAEAIAVARPVG